MAVICPRAARYPPFYGGYKQVTSNAMTDDQNIIFDPEDFEDLLLEVETSFGIKFLGDNMSHISTFGQLCDYIADKIQNENVDDCTSQQAFYKLRKAISTTLQIDPKKITTDFPLVDILPRLNRRSQTRKIEKNLGFKLNILRPPHWVIVTFIVLLLASLVAFIINWKIAIAGLVLSIVGVRIAHVTGNELDLETVGQVAEKMTRENYLKSRRNPKTYNRKEIEKVLADWFSKGLFIDKNKLTRDAKLFS